VGQLVVILKLPIYLDSIGTVLVGALLGPIAGAVTGILGTVIWAVTLNPGAMPYAIVAGVIGLMAGVFGKRGLFATTSPAAVGAVVGALFFLAMSVFVLTLVTFTGDIWAIADADGAQISLTSLFANNAVLLSGMIVVGAVAGYFLIRNGGYIGLAGILTGIVAAAVSAPISVYVSGGYNGSGTDMLVSGFQAAGNSIVTSVLAQGMVSDPFDKLASFMVVWAIINLLPLRVRDRFSAE
jgi:hypothetical protein